MLHSVVLRDQNIAIEVARITSLQLLFLIKSLVQNSEVGPYYGLALCISQDVSIYVSLVPLATWAILLLVRERRGRCIMWWLACAFTCQMEKQLPTLRSRTINFQHMLFQTKERSRFVWNWIVALYVTNLVLRWTLVYMVLFRQVILITKNEITL